MSHFDRTEESLRPYINMLMFFSLFNDFHPSHTKRPNPPPLMLTSSGLFSLFGHNGESRGELGGGGGERSRCRERKLNSFSNGFQSSDGGHPFQNPTCLSYHFTL